MWGRLAQIANDYVKKGEAVLICGRLRLETWVKDGQKRSKLKVVASRLQRLTKKDNYQDNHKINHEMNKDCENVQEKEE